jgi:hypothetical protein
MSRKPTRPCKELRDRKPGDPLDLCHDFTPSYPVGREIRRQARARAARLASTPSAPPYDIQELLDAAQGWLALETPVTSATALSVVAEDTGDLEGILDEAGLALPAAPLDQLLATGVVADLLPTVDQPLSRDPRVVYQARVAECDRLLAEEGEVAWRRAGCKRDSHLMLPGGRGGLTEPGPRRRVGAATRQRWADGEPPLTARTQSPEAHAYAEARKGRVGLLAQKIEQGLLAYAQRTGQPDKGPVVLPARPAGLIEAGVPAAAAVALTRPRQGVRLRTLRRHKGNPTLMERFLAVFGLLALRVNHDLNGVNQGTYFDLTGRDLRRVRTKELHAKTQEEHPRSIVALMTQLRGPLRPKKKRTPVSQQRLYVWDVRVVYADGRQTSIPLTAQHEFWDALNYATERRKDWTLVLQVGAESAPRTIKLQHSVFFGPAGEEELPDYTTLRGLALPELAHILAQQLADPRKRRRGRQLPPLQAKTNPVPTYVLTDEMTAGMEEGDSRPYSAGATRSPPHGQFIYKNARGGLQVVSAKRLLSWKRLGERNLEAKHLLAEQAASAATTNPRSLERRPKMARRNPRKSLGLSSNRRLNKPDLQTGLHYPGTVWDYYELGEFQSGQSTVPVNRRNPSSKKKKARTLSRAQLAAGFGGKAAKARANQGRANPPKRRTSHSKSVHRYKDPTHKANAKLAMSYKHGANISLSEAWGHVKAGTTPRATGALNNPRRLGTAGYASSRQHGRDYWPRHSPYSQVQGPYGASSPISPARRNPIGGKTLIGRFPSPCKNCGASMKNAEIHQVGIGPRGGKQMAHVNCGGY